MKKSKRGDIGEELVISELRKYQNPYFLINNLMLLDDNGGSHQIDHIFICQKAIFVIETKYYYGEISSNDGDSIWLKKVHGRIDKISNPMFQNISHTRVVNQILGKMYPCISLVVFARNNAPYLPDDNVINLNQLMLFINEYPGDEIISQYEMKEINDILLIREADISIKSHLNKIDEIKTKRKERQKEIKKAIETHACPRCNSPLKMEGDELVCQNAKCKYKVKL